jgi:thiol:disulfide interchange protein DsbD
MTAILATPCSFAILVLALAWAQVQAIWLGSLTIILIGVGMAGPHAMLAGVPELLRRLPRPGRWMELLRQSMGFVLLLVAVWLISTLSSDTHVARVIGYAVVLAFCLWVWGSWLRYDASLGAKVIVRGLAVGLAVGAGVSLLRSAKAMATEFKPFDKDKIASARAAGRTVLVDFTAAWCLSCKIVDLQIYDDPAVAAELKARGVLAVRGDVTTADLPANRLLYEELRGAPPLTVIFPPAGQPVRLEGKFSKARLLEALDAAGAKTAGG